MLDDKRLIMQLKRGSSEALRRIYEKYRLYLLKLATALYHDVNVAEDIVHDVFLRLARSPETYTIRTSLKAYLRTCLINGVRSHIRAGNVRSTVGLSEADSVVSGQGRADQWASLKEESAKIHDALAQLPFEQREAVVLHLHGDMTFRQIAKLQAVSIKTIQSRYRYGLDKLRSHLKCEVEK